MDFDKNTVALEDYGLEEEVDDEVFFGEEGCVNQWTCYCFECFSTPMSNSMKQFVKLPKESSVLPGCVGAKKGDAAGRFGKRRRGHRIRRRRYRRE